MTPGKSALLVLLLVVIAAVGIPLFLNYRESMALESEYEALIEEGLGLLEEPVDGEDVDEAIRKGLAARDLFPEGKEVHLLLGRCYIEKKSYNKAVEELSPWADDFSDLDYFPEFNYHLGLAYSRLYMDLKQDDLRNKALSHFGEATSAGYHGSDAYFGMGALHYAMYRDNQTNMLKEMAMDNFQLCIDAEEDMEGYVEGEPGSPCPLCSMTFNKKMENETFSRLMKFLLGD